MNFTAIDFETAVGARNSICQIGMVIVKNGEITETITKLVQPPHNEYFYRNIQVHGITPDMTEDSPYFCDVWEDIKPYIEDQLIVAHNAAFDVSCLKKTLEYYNLPIPNFTQACTYRQTNKKLNIACADLGIELNNHHDAECDALACAKIYMKLNSGTLF